MGQREDAGAGLRGATEAGTADVELDVVAEGGIHVEEGRVQGHIDVGIGSILEDGRDGGIETGASVQSLLVTPHPLLKTS